LLTQVREFLFSYAREASKRAPIFDGGTRSKPAMLGGSNRLRSGSLEADLSLIIHRVFLLRASARKLHDCSLFMTHNSRSPARDSAETPDLDRVVSADAAHVKLLVGIGPLYQICSCGRSSSHDVKVTMLAGSMLPTTLLWPWHFLIRRCIESIKVGFSCRAIVRNRQPSYNH